MLELGLNLTNTLKRLNEVLFALWIPESAGVDLGRALRDSILGNYEVNAPA